MDSCVSSFDLAGGRLLAVNDCKLMFGWCHTHRP